MCITNISNSVLQVSLFRILVFYKFQPIGCILVNLYFFFCFNTVLLIT